MAVEIEKLVGVAVSAKDFVDGLKVYDVAELVEAVAERFDKDFCHRTDAANAFANGLSEQGVRFLAEVVTSYHGRRQGGRS